MRRLVLGWKKFGLEQSLGSRIVTYADDLVILCRKGNAEMALQRLHEITGKLKLTVNEEKTRICRSPGEAFDFLGYTFGRREPGCPIRPSKIRPIHPCIWTLRSPALEEEHVETE